MAERIQRRRTKGWRMPEGAVYVGRPSRWGNPWRPRRRRMEIGAYVVHDAAAAVARFRERLAALAPLGWFEPLRGKDLVCWCPLDRPCHADVLLELANRRRERPTVTDRLARQADRTEDCWVWRGARDGDGYGLIKVDGVLKRATRVAWEAAFGAIPAGLSVLHSCDNPPCIRVDHLMLGTQRANVRDSIAKGRRSSGAA